ncbi:competence type IV pilus ATPase ComGA [Agrilactobacillus yilanensis]|uniref:Competence type IV pilus ATPase ComGA n=1 Tax=Agrilactobacillus yilanensis TaxID=2485997 RepID=A0ABW4JA59_9LACO|nr:competence type IV pilus ATPase ComGA [Agrilactobacillus yilanensis]
MRAIEIKKVVEQIIQYAYQQQASDIYLVPQADCYDLTLRIQDTHQFIEQRSFHETISLISFLKYKAQMNISENRRPQSGTLSLEVDGKTLQLRLSSIGDFKNRESLVIRLLYDKVSQLNFFFETQVQQLQALTQKRGLFVFSGATGSGKTTTMYLLAKALAKNETVIAVEDPVEIETPEILQLQVNEAAGMDYMTLVKGTLRHRPDTLIIGEIRDAKTAQTAVTAALSGHLVLTTVHARSTGGVVERLLDLGLSTNVLQNTLTTVCYQRLLTDRQQQPHVLCDVLTGEGLNNAIQQPGQGFVQWQEQLKKLRDYQRIEQQTYEKFKDG